MKRHTRRDAVVYGMVGIPASFDPHDQVLPNDFGIRVAFDSLLVPGQDGELIPRLAESFRNIDSSTWEFKLRSGLKFASGRQLDAEAVKWNFDRVAKRERLAITERLNTYDRTEIIDAATIRFKTRVPDVIWPRRALQVVIADPAEAPPSGPWANPGPRAGSGPFSIVEFVPDKIVRLEASRVSWRGVPEIEALEMRPYDPDGLSAAFRQGEVDLGYLEDHQIGEVMASGFHLQRRPQANVHTIRFSTLAPPFSDKRLREAAFLALDQQAIIDAHYNGHGFAPNQIVGRDCFGFDPRLPRFSTNRGRARKLVEATGFSGTLTFDVLKSSAVLRPWCDAAIQAFNDVGLRTVPNYVDMATYLGKMIRNEPRRSDIIGAGNQYGPGLDADFALNKFSNKLPAHLRTYDNPLFQETYELSLAEFDMAKRERLLQLCTRTLLDDFAGIPMLQPSLGWLVHSRLQGLNMNTLGAGWVDWLAVKTN